MLILYKNEYDECFPSAIILNICLFKCRSSSQPSLMMHEYLWKKANKLNLFFFLALFVRHLVFLGLIHKVLPFRAYQPLTISFESRDQNKPNCTRTARRSKYCKMADYTTTFVFMFSSLIFYHIYANEFSSTLSNCKNSCERSYPLHTYPKVSFCIRKPPKTRV